MKTELPTAIAAQLSWMTGNWQGETEGDPIEECWSTAGGGTMMGMFRWLKEGTVYLYEFMAIEPEGNALSLRIKHFNSGLTGWQEKDAAVVFDLVRVGDGEAVFERRGEEFERIVYRASGESGLTVRLEDAQGGETSATEFTFTRHS